MKAKTIAFCVVFSLVGGANARAEKTLWSMIAGACVPNNNTATQGLIHRDAGGAYFAHDKTGEAELFCPVESAPGAIKKVDWIKVTLNRTLAGGSVRARLSRMEGSSGRIMQLGRGARAAADHKGLGTFNGSVGESGKGHTFEEGYFYYVRIVVEKHGLNNRISVKGVSLGVN